MALTPNDPYRARFLRKSGLWSKATIFPTHLCRPQASESIQIDVLTAFYNTPYRTVHFKLSPST